MDNTINIIETGSGRGLLQDNVPRYAEDLRKKYPNLASISRQAPSQRVSSDVPNQNKLRPR